MPIDRDQSAVIIRSAIEASQAGQMKMGFRKLSGVQLVHLLPSVREREAFRHNVHGILKSSGFRIALSAIPAAPHVTIEDIIITVALSALPGDPTTGDQD